MNRSEIVKLIILRSIGNFLVLFSLYGVLATFGPGLSYELRFRVMQMRKLHFSVQTKQSLQSVNTSSAANVNPNRSNSSFASQSGFVGNQSEPGFAELLAGDKEQVLIPKDTQFSILIPSIGASAKIYPNVDPANRNDYLPILQKGIAHAKGSVFPGMQGNVYLFAHSTDNWWDVGRYNAVFYLLKDLTLHDQIIIYFENRRYDYFVVQKIISDPQDITLLTHEQQGAQQLVLQTCWPPGTTWKRLYIIAVPRREMMRGTM